MHIKMATFLLFLFGAALSINVGQKPNRLSLSEVLGASQKLDQELERVRREEEEIKKKLVASDRATKEGLGKEKKGLPKDYDDLIHNLFKEKAVHLTRNETLTTERTTTEKHSKVAMPELVHTMISSLKKKLKQLKDEAGPPNSYRLKNIKSVVSPDLLYHLAEAGAGDQIVFAANGFPSVRLVTNSEKLIRLDGVTIPVILNEVMKLITISNCTDYPIILEKSKANESDPTNWMKYKAIIEKAEQRIVPMAKMNKEKFLELAKKANVIVQTGEPDPRSSIIITKGHIPNSIKAVNKTHITSSTTEATTTLTSTTTMDTLGKEKEETDLEALKRKLRLLQS